MSFEAVLKDQDAGRAARAVERRSLKLQTRTQSASAGDVPVLVHNISPTGLLIEAHESALGVGDTFVIDVPEAGPADCTVVWNSGRFFGCEFLRPIAKAAVSAALLRSAPQSGPASPSITQARSGQADSVLQAKIVPERNFLAAVMMAMALWALIGSAAYLAFA